jgi:hypothetical protein
MRAQSRASRVAFRRAVWASVALHTCAACLLLLLLRSSAEHAPAQPGIDTRADQPQVRISLTDEVTVSVEAPSAPHPNPAPVESHPPLPAKPFAPVVPQTLPPELLALLRKALTNPIGAAVIEVSVTPGALNSPPADPNVRPAGGSLTPPVGAPTGPSAKVIHGAMKPGQTVVYVLDCSGSMGAAGKFEAARGALVATLQLQPVTVRFQVIAYAGTAQPLLASDGTALPASATNVRTAAEKLATLEPRGRSNHLDAIRAALAFRPDVILILTDADDLSGAALRPVLASAPQPVPVRIAQVTAGGAQPPRELK